AVKLAKAWHRRDDRIGAVREHHVIRRVAYAVHVDGAGTREPAVPADQRDAAVRQPTLLTGIGVVRDHEVPPGEGRLDVDVCGRSGMARRIDRLAWSQQRLRRDARPV